MDRLDRKCKPILHAIKHLFWIMQACTQSRSREKNNFKSKTILFNLKGIIIS